ncbi:MAG: carboxypeptidase regulatory-like domain-containing protein [Planctomycetes bacterium]|nr:carboxypeptidase regulatory-like domain-containing protein [Planctomycetota bacterium]
MRRALPGILILLVAAFLGLVLARTGCERAPTPAPGREGVAGAHPAPPLPAPPGGVDAPERDDARAVEARPQAPVSEPPSATPIAPADPTEAELEAFAGSAPPKTIEGIVLRGAVPIRGGRVWIAASSAGGLPWGAPETWTDAGAVQSASIGADGRFSFEGLASDDYAVCARAEDGATRRTWVAVTGDQSSRRIRIVLGDGGLRGRVFDDLGAPCAGWQVAVNNWGRMLAGEQLVAGAVTDARGAFEFAGLTGGAYVVTICPATNFNDPRRRVAFVDLPPGEWRTVDFGATAEAGHVWSGGIVTPRGAPLLLEPPLALIVESNGVRAQWPLEADAQFRLRIAPGVLRLALEYGHMRRVDAGELVMPEHDLGRDVAVPRCLVRVRATSSVPGAEGQERLARLALALKVNGPYDHRGQRAADGHTYFLGLLPGEHVLVSPGLPIQGVPRGEHRFRVLPEDDELDLDIVVGDG